jgi:hypothetical protein
MARADVDGYSFTVGDFHLLLFAGFDRRTRTQEKCTSKNCGLLVMAPLPEHCGMRT